MLSAVRGRPGLQPAAARATHRRRPTPPRPAPAPPPVAQTGVCRRGDACPYSHGVFECWLHPSRYRTQMCTDGPSCRRRVCFFAHYEHELRRAEEYPPLLNQQLHAGLVAGAWLGWRPGADAVRCWGPALASRAAGAQRLLRCLKAAEHEWAAVARCRRQLAGRALAALNPPPKLPLPLHPRPTRAPWQRRARCSSSSWRRR